MLGYQDINLNHDHQDGMSCRHDISEISETIQDAC